ncbi:hypothetical protein KM043_002306 [Ampulex compressa]|nr:hypothetical protein KM043_002306 [Ampulex compressa]
MVETDWKRILSVNPSTLTDDEIENLCPTVIQCEVEEIDDIHNLRTLMKLSQEMLQYKDNQVESLLLECGELKETISSLKPEASKRRKKERETPDVKHEDSRFAKQADASESVSYEDTLQGKNKKIKSLMEELEGLDKENIVLKKRLSTLTQEMEDATEKMNDMTEELTAVQTKSTVFTERISTLERENMALAAQIEEITSQQIDRDKVIDDFGMAIDARITEWKSILDEKDAEIEHLKENLSQSLMHSVAPQKEESISQIVHLNEEIEARDRIIGELQAKLSEAITEINDSATLVEKLKMDAQKATKGDRRKEQRDLLKKLQDAHEKISDLQNALAQAQENEKSKSSKLCEVLSTLRNYEDENKGLAGALFEIKELKSAIDHKNEHIGDLANVVNKLEMLNSYQEMEILTLREKLGIPEDESISIKNTVAKRKEETRKKEQLLQQNKLLVEENLELKSDIRMLKYKLNKSARALDFPNNALESSTEFLHSTKLPESDSTPVYPKSDIDQLRKNAQIVIEENEALRKGMHEILDSIRNQDGKSAVEIQSSTLERLLEALDVRHLAGWYHPAMRLQEHLNVVQGSNAELRSQLKQLRKELHKKDGILQSLALGKNVDIDKLYSEDSESEKMTVYLSELKNLQNAYENEAEEWESQKERLIGQNDALNDEMARQKLQLEIYQSNWKALEEGEDEIKKALAVKTREYVEISTELLATNRNNTLLQLLYDKETTKAYNYQKETVLKESNLKKALAESNKQNKMFESEISALRSNLANSISILVYNELKEKHEELCIRFRNLLENGFSAQNDREVQMLKAELEMAKEDKRQFEELLRKEEGVGEEQDSARELRELRTKELVERQRADHVTQLHEISQSQLGKCDETIKELTAKNSDLQEELIALHRNLSRVTRPEDNRESDDNKVQELLEINNSLGVEIEHLKRVLQISQEEAREHYALNALKISELDSLRHQILDLQAISEDKATISRLDFELSSSKISEMELNTQKVRLEGEVSHLQDELSNSQKSFEELRIRLQDCQKQCESRCRTYVDTITFLQSQYAGSSSANTLERVLSMFMKLRNDRQSVETDMRKAKECYESARLQQDLLNNRLQIVNSLKDILEQQIGSNSVQDIMQRFSEYSQHSLNDFRYKRRISHLDNELQMANQKFLEYETVISGMEEDMINIQKVWGQQRTKSGKSETQSSGTSPIPLESNTVPIQAGVETRSIAVQTDPYTCCMERKETTEVELQVEFDAPVVDAPKKEVRGLEEAERDTRSEEGIGLVSEQLNQALKLAADRATTLTKYETQITECRAQVEALNKTIESKDLQLAQRDQILEDYKAQQQPPGVDCSDKLALKSTINSMQKLIGQKEETIARYQNLLKEDRDEHSRAAARLQEEIKNLHDRILTMQNEAQRCRQRADSLINEAEKPDEKASGGMRTEIEGSAMREDEIARLREKISTLEADLNITKELSERWRKLADERLEHMDRMRERLEEQHKSELESYSSELNRWHSEADSLRKQLSENRTLLTKGNISLMRELQERDDKIHELSLTCQQLQNEVEMMESTNRSQQVVVHGECEAKMHELTQTISRDQLQQQSQADLVRRQLKSSMEKEKMYKHEIADLKQRLSRRYMAVKSQEKRASHREAQLERRVKTLEEELQKAQAQLSREFLVQEAKKAKTAEELSLWEKQKRWQQTAERLKERLKEKTEEYAKLLSNYEKLRSVVSCMEREKWYLKSKLKIEGNSRAGSLSARPISAVHPTLVDDLQKECQTLRDRVKELTDRLENEDNEQLMQKIDEQKRRIAALEAVSEGNTCVINQLEKLEMTKDILEKMNLKLESENFELRLEMEKANSETPRLREKVEHLEKYIELLKVEKSSESSPRSSDKESQDHGNKKSHLEMEKTIFTLKRIIEKLQVENKRLKVNAKRNHFLVNQRRPLCFEDDSMLQQQYELAQKRVIALETDLQLAEQRVAMLERAQKDDDSGDMRILKQQLSHKSDLLDKVKELLTRAAMNEKALRQRIHQLESKHAHSTIPECYVLPTISEN